MNEKIVIGPEDIESLRKYAGQILWRLGVSANEGEADDWVNAVLEEAMIRGTPRLESPLNSSALAYLKRNIQSRILDLCRRRKRQKTEPTSHKIDSIEEQEEPDSLLAESLRIAWEETEEMLRLARYPEEKLRMFLPLLQRYVVDLRELLDVLYEQRHQLQKREVFYLAVILLELRRSAAVFVHQYIPEDTDIRGNWEDLLAECGLSCMLEPFGSAVERLAPWTSYEESLQIRHNHPTWPNNRTLWQHITPHLYLAQAKPCLESQRFCDMLRPSFAQEQAISTNQWHKWVSRAKEIGVSILSWQRWRDVLGFWMPVKNQ